MDRCVISIFWMDGRGELFARFTALRLLFRIIDSLHRTFVRLFVGFRGALFRLLYNFIRHITRQING